MYDEREDFRTHRTEVEALVAVLRSAGTRITREMTVLDVGGGQGMHAGFLSALAGRVFCADVIDYSSLYDGQFLKLLDEKHGRNGVEFHLDRVAFHTTDAMNLFYRDALFDCIVSINSFEHIPDPGRALAEWVRVTRPGGHIYIATDPIWTADSGSHFFHRVPEPWAHLVDGDERFAERMLANGASPGEVVEYRHAMNRWRMSEYLGLVERMRRAGSVDVVHFDSWSGFTDPAHERHPNRRRLEQDGYAREELAVRGLRWVMKKR